MLTRWKKSAKTFYTVFILYSQMHWNPRDRQICHGTSLWLARTLSLHCCWRDEWEGGRCLVRSTTEWLVNAVWSAKGRSGSEIRQAWVLHTFNLVNLRENTPMKCLFYHKSLPAALHYEPWSVLHMLRSHGPCPGVLNYHQASNKVMQEHAILTLCFINGPLNNQKSLSHTLHLWCLV